MASTGRYPLISVIVPCFNYGAFVAECIYSVLAQTYPNFELVVVDDGSTDNSVEVIEAAIAQGVPGSFVRRVEFIRQANQGVSAALNAGLAIAAGEYVATFDADDVMVAGRLAVQVGYLRDRPEVGCLGGQTITIDETGKLLPRKNKKRSVSQYTFDDVLAQALCVGGNIAVYRREAIERVGGYDPSIKIQDFQMTLKIAAAGYRIDILPDVVTFYRRHGDSLSKNYIAEYRYSLQVIQPFADHPRYESAKARLICKALRLAVVHDKRFAWALFRQVPARQWDRQLLRRLRHFLIKRPRPGPIQRLI